MQEIVSFLEDFIARLGFPIAVAVYMIYVNKQQTEKHQQESKEFTNAINELKVVMQALVDRLDGK